MVAVMAVLMVGGEHSTEDDSTWDPLGLRSLNPDSERCASNGQDTFVLDNIFALIDEYICADLSIDPSLFPCSRAADHTFREVGVLRFDGLELHVGARYRGVRASCVDILPDGQGKQNRY
jgi:hypothetical protein